MDNEFRRLEGPLQSPELEAARRELGETPLTSLLSTRLSMTRLKDTGMEDILRTFQNQSANQEEDADLEMPSPWHLHNAHDKVGDSGVSSGDVSIHFTENLAHMSNEENLLAGKSADVLASESKQVPVQIPEKSFTGSQVTPHSDKGGTRRRLRFDLSPTYLSDPAVEATSTVGKRNNPDLSSRSRSSKSSSAECYEAGRKEPQALTPTETVSKNSSLPSASQHQYSKSSSIAAMSNCPQLGSELVKSTHDINLSSEAGNHLLRSLSMVKGKQSLGSPLRLPSGSPQTRVAVSTKNNQPQDSKSSLQLKGNQCEVRAQNYRASSSAKKSRTPSSRELRRSSQLRTPRHRQKPSSKVNQTPKSKPRPAWDSTIHDLSKFKLNEEAQKKHRLQHVSRFDRSARKRLENEGVSAEEQDLTLNSILSPTWLIKSPTHRDSKASATGINMTEVRSTVPLDNHSLGDDSLKLGNDTLTIEQSQPDNKTPTPINLQSIYQELVAQVSRYESTSGREFSPALVFDTKLLYQQSENREKELLKLCTRLITHLASCERDLANQFEQLQKARKDILEREALCAAVQTQNEKMKSKVEALQNDISQLHLLETSNKNKNKCNARDSTNFYDLHQAHAQITENERADTDYVLSNPQTSSSEASHFEKDQLARISRRHQLLASWQAGCEKLTES
mmetsp:Transcript_21361/g.41867  ORF Transcript_21361/g.41867 Transcript_21361/m.41867 type:complete len:679 (+) Transcript_21361:184-2220(+)|eukprot:CAMPEP_0171571704 /NCGR_PEP_ID=MMETSP0961-20121227/3658_1 /TAXON_ID=87120 /ORGANISM="Aurantiochytrium limacinum, Strain ATCCMYA-1381" /LENGTH=678 /DNA_ID=CAMNT_0012126355 /DNA_START=82 /DNA_END=2118 /DNA_ORIENTATION=+